MSLSEDVLRNTRMAIAILAQGKSLEQAIERGHSAPSSTWNSICMQQKEEEQDPLFYDLPLSRLLNWNRWWHLIEETVRLVYQKKTWGAIGSLLKRKKGIFTVRVVLLRKIWSARGQELKRIKHLPDDELECNRRPMCS